MTQVHIDAEGKSVVTEKVTCVFSGEYHGIYRVIPIEYPGPKSTNFTLYLKILNVTDESGAALRYEVSNTSDGRRLKIYIPNATDATREVDIYYSVKNAIRHFADYDEFYWNVTGNDWPVPIDHAEAHVTLPEKAADAGLRAQAFTGMYGATEQEASAKVERNRVDFETTNPLAMRAGMTVDIYIPKGIIREPSVLTRLFWFVGSNPILFLPVFAFAVMYGMWSVKGRDPNPGMSVAPMYEPPVKMSPAECGALLGDEVHPRDITSTVVDLAVRGFLRIEETQEKHIFTSSSDYIFHLLKGRTEWQSLASHEQTLLEGMFTGEAGETCTLSSLRNHFYTSIPVMKGYIESSLNQKGMYGLDPDSAHGYALVGALLIAGPFVALQWAGIVNFALSMSLLILCVILSAIIFFVFARIMPAKSLLGARTVVGIQGFQEFMNRVEGDKLRTMPSNTFEKYLPYAMALGVEEHWAHAFNGIVQQPPTWYTGQYPGTFNPMVFTQSIRTMTDAAGDTFASAPRASSTGSGFSSGGGFGGGGFSGGGFGGGGGDAF